ncbi:gly-9, partial [Symbiodinium sp. KB8]
EILAQVRLNPRRMVVPAITDLDLDTFDERADSQVNAKCYLTLDADFKWFDDESDFIPTISGGLVAMGREWFNATGGFDEEMHGWGGENLDQSLRAWLCGGDIVRAKTSRVAHMWRTGKDRRTATHYVIKARGTNNRGRVVAAWFGPFREVSRSSVKEDQVLNYNGFKKRLHCLPFSYFLYRFRKLYIEGGVIAREYFRLQEVASGLCLGRRTLGNCTQGGKLFLQRGNVDRDTGSCCSGIRLHGTNDCFDYFDQSGPHPYSCDVMGRNMNQQYRLLEDGRLQKGDGDCVVSRSGGAGTLELKKCDALSGNEGAFRIIERQEPREYELYREELAKYQWDKVFPDLPDN